MKKRSREEGERGRGLHHMKNTLEVEGTVETGGTSSRKQRLMSRAVPGTQ